MTQPNALAEALEPLKACPFCGRADTPYIYQTPVAEYKGIECETDRGGCGASLIAEGEHAVIAAWNRRASIEKPAAVDGGGFSEWSTSGLAGQRRMQAREQLDPEFSQFMEAVAARLSALAPAPGRWQDIATAPKDGTEFQAWVTSETPRGNKQAWWEPKARINPGSEAIELWGRVDYDQDGWEMYSHVTVTHWMPLPEAPTAGEEGGRDG